MSNSNRASFLIIVFLLTLSQCQVISKSESGLLGKDISKQKLEIESTLPANSQNGNNRMLALDDKSALYIQKMLCFLIFCGIGLIALLPVYCTCISRNKKIISLLNTFGSGIFLSTALIHILPESVSLQKKGLAQSEGKDPHAGHDHRRMLDYLFTKENDKIFPFNKQLRNKFSNSKQKIQKRYLAGTYDAHAGTHDEHANLEKQKHEKEKKEEEKHEDSHGYPLMQLLAMVGQTLILMVERVLVNANSGEHGHSHGKIHNDLDNKNVTSTTNETNHNKNLNSVRNSDEANSTLSVADKPTNTRRRSSLVQLFNSIIIKYELTASARKSLSSVILSIVLTIHSIFEGIVIGLQKSPYSVFIISGAITGHKIFEATALGASFVKKEVPRKKTILWIVIFALGTPIGLAAGLLLSNTNDMVAGCLNALSAGTFLQITLTEIIPDEFDGTNRWPKFFAYLCGLAIMPVATIWQEAWHVH